MHWLIIWLAVLVMVGLTFGLIYGIIMLSHWGSEYVDLMTAIRLDKEQRLADKAAHDRKMLELQFEQQKKILIDSGMIDASATKQTNRNK